MGTVGDLGERMTTFYENISKTKLMRRTPVIIRLDGRAFHTLLKKFKKPFDDVFIETMQETARYLCENIQGCVFGYCFSDEISLLLIDYKKLESAAWFDYQVQKMCSVSASMATLAYNKIFSNLTHSYYADCCYAPDEGNYWDEIAKGKEADAEFCENVYFKALSRATFDARVFNIPKEEIVNYFYWRQSSCIRNSIQMTGRAYFKHKELQKKKCNDIKEMLLKKGIDWNSLPTHEKLGSCIIKTTVDENIKDRGEWIIDKEIPVFKDEGREYINSLLN